MSLDDLKRDWTRLGREDPLWAVMLLPGKRGGQWDVDEFLATGRADVQHTLDWIDQQQPALRTGTWQRVLDFGCGVGRLSQALAEHADEVVGVDISPTMLDTARQLDRSGGRCEFVLNDAPDLRQFPDGHFDLIYCALVLQHLPRRAIEGYLTEFVRVLSATGVAVVQLATAPLWTVKGMIWRFVPPPLIRWGQQRILGYPAPMRMTRVSDRALTAIVTAAGGEVLDRTPDPTYTEDWLATRYLLRRR